MRGKGLGWGPVVGSGAANPDRRGVGRHAAEEADQRVPPAASEAGLTSEAVQPHRTDGSVWQSISQEMGVSAPYVQRPGTSVLRPWGWGGSQTRGQKNSAGTQSTPPPRGQNLTKFCSKGVKNGILAQFWPILGAKNFGPALCARPKFSQISERVSSKLGGSRRI